MQDHKELSGKVVIVTGSSRNMGRLFGLSLAQKGADIVVHYHNKQALAEAQQTASLIKEQGVNALLFEGDLSKTAIVKQLFEETIREFGRVDIVINNAGKVIKKKITEITEEDYDSSFSVNAKAAFFVMKEAASVLESNGRIINIGTTILGATIPNYAVYAGSKGPLEHFTRALAKEIGDRGITVNTVAPGPIDDSFYHGQETPESAARASMASVAGRLGHPQDIVPVIEFLASQQSQWITAQTIFVNGGYLAR
ncbi:SDR family oxidoreductase [Flavitalea sp. BT771]|uniref:SDR family oxidoreductase n=1 Tax=Flavitalea sp. BT771 TaxID=3063329 RepID=UPI0026E3C178|nr:SDR family oxidoreductase [Flavitalea sp. BT771]MDO6432660.1 SDR family oxidoreductase [Flavitalea sp. BT771]MDV6222064.1 SDR family oxidoreductase [Flavitalea sp. BT771]